MKKRTAISIILISIALVIGIITIIILLKGETKTIGKNPENIQGQSLTCTSQDVAYPFFTYDNSTTKELKIIANFYNENINAISLNYTQYYYNNSQITASEAHNHAAMNISFGNNGLGPDSYNAHYSKMDDSMRMSLYISASNINEMAAKYFMLKTNGEKLPTTPTEFQKIYEEQGLTCILDN